MEIVFAIFLGIFLLIGVSSAFFKQKNSRDYLLAGQNVKPWMVALSAVATNNSGYMFIGMIGFTYQFGLASIWIMIGWILGDFLASRFIYAKLRNVSGSQKMSSFGEIISYISTGKVYKAIRIVIGVISIVFLSVYASAQLGAGAKALEVTMDIEKNYTIVGGALLVLIYCFSGGIRASVWTDAVQSFVMIFAMFSLVYAGIVQAGGLSMAIDNLNIVSENYMSIWPRFDGETNNWTRTILFIVGWFFAGFGVVGQPHIMVRYMTLDDEKNMKKVKYWYYSWFTAFYILTIIVGLLSRILLVAEEGFDAETALPSLALQLLPNFYVGIILAGIFAATISTADSLIISCSASFTNDVFSKMKGTYWKNKMATIIITAISLTIALYANKSIFELVVYSWAVLGAAFGLPLTLGALNIQSNNKVIMATMIAGAAGAILWKVNDLNEYTYEILPGFVLAFITWFIGNKIIGKQKLNNA